MIKAGRHIRGRRKTGALIGHQRKDIYLRKNLRTRMRSTLLQSVYVSLAQLFVHLELLTKKIVFCPAFETLTIFGAKDTLNLVPDQTWHL